MLGTVVIVMYLMWVIKSVPATAGARFVVSERGESLSPKYAPLIIAPATQPSWMPNADPIPIKAIPTVPMVPQDDPVARLSMAQTTQAAKRKIEGSNI